MQTIINCLINIVFVKMQKIINCEYFSLLFDLNSNVNAINAVNNNNIFKSKFQIKKINFFDFKYNEKNVFNELSLKNINKNIIYRNIHIFTKRT